MKHIELFDSFEKNHDNFEYDEYHKDTIKVLKDIADGISSKINCDMNGSCVHFAELFVLAVNDFNPKLLDKFNVIEGYVNASIGDGIPQQHTWIVLENNDIIDPTFTQFTKYGYAYYAKRIKNSYSGLEYFNDTKGGTWFSDRRERHDFRKMLFK